MWRVTLTLIVHRFLIFCVGWGAIHFSSSSEKGFPVLLSDDLLSQAALYLSSQAGVHPDLVLVVLSNTLLLLFLWQIHAFLNQLALPDVATNTCILIILWVSSYELSLGSPLVIKCVLLALILRLSNDGFWLLTSVFLGLFSTQSFLGLMMMPFLFLLLWSQTRFAPKSTLARKSIYLLAGLVLPIFFKWSFWQTLPSTVSGSLLLHLSELFSLESLGPSFAFVFFGLGSFFSLIVFTSLSHRLLVLCLFLGLCLITPWNLLGSSVLLITPVLVGLVELFPTPLLKITQLVLLFMGLIEVFNTFHPESIF